MNKTELSEHICVEEEEEEKRRVLLSSPISDQN